MPTRILIADDNPSVRAAMCDVLAAVGGWEIIEAANGEEAVAKAGEFKPGLVILDLVMPVKNGLAASREITRLLPGTPILLHTLYSSPQVEIEAAKTGVRKVVAKSETTVLVSAVQDALNPDVQATSEEALSFPRPEREPLRQRTEDRIRELCAQILGTTNSAALATMLPELRDSLHRHIESFRLRLAEYPGLSERRVRNGVSPSSAAAEPAKNEKSDATNEAPPTAGALEREPKLRGEPKAANGG